MPFMLQHGMCCSTISNVEPQVNTDKYSPVFHAQIQLFTINNRLIVSYCRKLNTTQLLDYTTKNKYLTSSYDH